MNIYTRIKQNEKNPKSMVVMLHGWGANAADLISIADAWIDDFPDTLFIAPDAPEVCDQNPFGFQWFSLGDWSIESLMKGAGEANIKLDVFLHELMKERGISPDKTVLMGFSQGMMMAFYTGMRQKEPLAGILGYSGAVFDTAKVTEQGFPKLPVCLIHGLADDVVPVQMCQDAIKDLTAAKYDVDSLLVPGLPHGIDPSGIDKGAEFLRRVLG